MRFTVQRPALLEKLERAKAIAARKSTIPILSHVKFSLTHDALKLAATDLDVTYRGTVSAISGQGDGEFCLPAQKLFEIIKAMPENEILFDLEPSGNKCAVSSGKAKFRLTTSPVNDFPSTEWPQFNDSSVDVLSMTFDSNNLRYGLLQTIYAATQDAARFALGLDAQPVLERLGCHHKLPPEGIALDLAGYCDLGHPVTIGCRDVDRILAILPKLQVMQGEPRSSDRPPPARPAAMPGWRPSGRAGIACRCL